MKLIFCVSVAIVLLQITLARQEFGKHDMWWSKKYSEHRAPPIAKRSKFAVEDPVEEKWIEMPLNHFDPQDNRTFNMRYMENRAHLRDGGPVYIFIGGEWWIDNYTLIDGHVPDMMRETNGIMFYTEHRYYGLTWPTPDVTTESLRFLNIDQALADLAHFIVHMKSSIPEISNSGVVLIGGSYSATMATWFMQKYPHLANGAWSSSAPLEAKVDFIEYFEVVTDAMKHFGGEKCFGRIKSAFDEIERLIEQGNAERLEEIFMLCAPLRLSDDLDRWSFGSSVGGSFAGLVQYHREFYQDIQSECRILENIDKENDLEAFAHWWWWGDGDGPVIDPEYPDYPMDFCFDHRYEGNLWIQNSTSWYDIGVLLSWRQWFYQTCAEYGWYQSSGSDQIIFGSHFPANLSVQLCHDIYGDSFTPERIQNNVDRTNVIYGAKAPNVRNVYSTHGQFDPWRPMGVQDDINDSSPTLILPNETHCSDFSSLMPDIDSPEMVASKQRVRQLFRQWLGLSD